jgi:hypothetical protein
VCNENIIDPNEYGTGDEYEIYRLILVHRFYESEYLITWMILKFVWRVLTAEI